MLNSRVQSPFNPSAYSVLYLMADESDSTQEMRRFTYSKIIVARIYILVNECHQFIRSNLSGFIHKR